MKSKKRKDSEPGTECTTQQLPKQPPS